jgi:serine/threonine-protein phosphatase 2B regulatory subunit
MDRGRKGYISGEEFISIPELSINPIAQVLAALACISTWALPA